VGVLMIPEFDERGYLPPGIHPAKIEEIGQRFGAQSEIRQSQFESLCWLLELARKAKVLKFIINGSFVTDILEPNDVDCTLLIEESAPMDHELLLQIQDGLPFLDVQVANKIAYDIIVNTIYATDRWYVPKGVVEMLL
jgi:hypothetical protein